MVVRRKRTLALLVGLGALLLADQVVLHTAMADGEFLGHELAPFVPPLYGEAQRALLDRYEEKLTWPAEKRESESLFDAHLGWGPRPGQVRRGERFDWSGSRIAHGPLPRTKPAGHRRIALFGCSYTHGSEVAPTESWSARLDAKHPELQFANLGVPGYGMDQALLRFRRDGLPLEADEVWLGYFPSAALRVTSRFPPLFSRWRSLTVNFKPCFRLTEGGDLELLPSPAQAPRDTAELLRNPDSFWNAMADRDRWMGRSPGAYRPLGDHWSHYSGAGRLLLTLHERSGREVPPHLENPASDIYKLNLAILKTFAREVEASGARFRLMILPSTAEIHQIRTEGRGFWDPLVSDLKADGIQVHDLARELEAQGVVPGDKHWMPQGHYSPPGNELVAQSLERAWLLGN